MADCHPLIISGAPRSGTSLLYNLFDGHSEIAWLVDEGFLFEYLSDLGSGSVDLFLDAVPADVDAFVAGLRDKQVMPPMHLTYVQSRERGSVAEVEIKALWDEKLFRAALLGSRETSVAGLWHRLVTACLAGIGAAPKRYACIKAPDYGKSAATALETISEAHAIVIVRDPVYALDSLKRSRELRGEKLLTWPLLAQNIRSFQQMHTRVSSADQTRLRTIRYEDLVADTEGVMMNLAVWLGIPFEPSFLKPTMRGLRWPGISSFEVTNGIDSSPVTRPVQALTDGECYLIRTHLAEFRKVYDYE